MRAPLGGKQTTEPKQPTPDQLEIHIMWEPPNQNIYEFIYFLSNGASFVAYFLLVGVRLFGLGRLDRPYEERDPIPMSALFARNMCRRLGPPVPRVLSSVLL